MNLDYLLYTSTCQCYEVARGDAGEATQTDSRRTACAVSQRAVYTRYAGTRTLVVSSGTFASTRIRTRGSDSIRFVFPKGTPTSHRGGVRD